MPAIASITVPENETAVSGECTDRRNGKKTEHFPPGQESKSPESPTIVTGSENSEVDSTADLSLNLPQVNISTSPTATIMPEKLSGSPERESSKSPEKCSDSLETEVAPELTESDATEKSLVSAVEVSDGVQEKVKKTVKILASETITNGASCKITALKSDVTETPFVSTMEVSDGEPEKVKKTVKMQASENISDGPSCKITALKPSPSVGTNLGSYDPSISPGSRSMMDEAWDRLKRSFVHYRGKPVGTLAALDPSAEALNYNQVFVRDFFPSALACLMKDPPELEVVKNFLLKTLQFQSREKKIDNFTLGDGVMPASFRVAQDSNAKEILTVDFGASAIGRVAPVDSGFWWIILLRSYTKCTRDYTLAELPDVQKGMKLILNLCLADGFDTFPTLLCADGCSMIDRRMGIYGYPIDIQALFFFALRCARQMLKPERGGKELIERIDKRITALSFHIQNYYWLDFTQLNNIYRYKTEEYSHTAVNKFNVIPESIPDWVFDFMTKSGGYLIGNVSPARMDFRWFLVGNCIAILSSLATPVQATAIMDLIEERWEDLIGEMPLKIAYPALEGHQWKIVTGCDPKNTQWSYHNGGSWPVLLWLLTAASIKTGRPQIAKRAIGLVEQRLSQDGWPEYYDGKTGRYIGKQARKYQTWSIAGYLISKMMIENPSHLLMISLEEDKKTVKPKLTRSNTCPLF